MSKQSKTTYIRHAETVPSKNNGVVSKQKRISSKATYSSVAYSYNSPTAGKTVYKSTEYMTTSTVRLANNRGYTEYYKQEKVTRVYYAATGSSGTKYGGAKKYLY